MRDLVAILAFVVILSGVAFGHARLLKSEPPNDAMLRVPPKVVRIWFNDELDPKQSSLSVWDSQGKQVDDGKGGVDLNDLDRTSMIVMLMPIGPGTYTVRWRAVSVDDLNVAQGTFRFTVT